MSAQSGSGGSWVTVTDPNEGAFAVQMPEGWRNEAAQLRVHGEPRSVATSQSPDGSVLLFLGDPNLPTFLVPSPMTMGFPMGGPMTQVHPYVPADAFFGQYAHGRYGQATGFRVTDIRPDPEAERAAREKAAQRGMNAHVTAVIVSCAFHDNGAPVRARLYGMTMLLGEIWVPTVAGVVTTGDPALYHDALLHMGRSYQTNPHWEQARDALHAQRMDQIQQNHQAVMTAMQAGHQARMNAIHESGAANTRAWQERQAQNDAAHEGYMASLRETPANPYAAGVGDSEDAPYRRFLNAVREQETVVDAGGQTYQVEAGHERYYVNRHTNQYVGTDAATSREDLSARWGVNPDDYEEVRIRR